MTADLMSSSPKRRCFRRSQEEALPPPKGSQVRSWESPGLFPRRLPPLNHWTVQFRARIWRIWDVQRLSFQLISPCHEQNLITLIASDLSSPSTGCFRPTQQRSMDWDEGMPATDDDK